MRGTGITFKTGIPAVVCNALIIINKLKIAGLHGVHIFGPILRG